MKKKSFYLVMSLLLLLGLSGIYVCQKSLQQQRREYHSIQHDAIQNIPPIVAFTGITLGGFRGLIADYLWLRSHLLQDQGNYYETYQLAQWITLLQPNVSSATTNLAWNMAYNISVTYSNYDDRWRWIQKAIELLRDDAIPKNPNSHELYYYLGWLYQHKIGQEADEANRYYKWRLAKDWEQVVGTDTDFAQMAATALPDQLVLRELPLSTHLKQLNLTTEQLCDQLLTQQTFNEEVKSYFSVEEQAILTLSARRLLLKKTFKMLPDIINEINQHYAPQTIQNYHGLDWRMPESHAIYWAYVGSKKNTKKELQCDRMILQCLAVAMRSGHIRGESYYVDQFNAKIPILLYEPNLNVIAPLIETLKKEKTIYGGNIIDPLLETVYIEAVTALYLYGYPQQAARYYDLMKQFNTEVGIAFNPNLSVEDYVTANIMNIVGGGKSSREVIEVINGYLRQAFLALLTDENERAIAMETVAKRIHSEYRKSLEDIRVSRINIADFAQFYRQSLIDFYQALPDPKLQQILLQKRPQLKSVPVAVPQPEEKEN